MCIKLWRIMIIVDTNKCSVAIKWKSLLLDYYHLGKTTVEYRGYAAHFYKYLLSVLNVLCFKHFYTIGADRELNEKTCQFVILHPYDLLIPRNSVCVFSFYLYSSKPLCLEHRLTLKFLISWIYRICFRFH